jgi:24-methylenesterol C-methyltransferase
LYIIMVSVLASFKASAGKAREYSSENPLLATTGVLAAASGCYLLAKYCTLSTTSDGRKGSFGLSLGKEKQGQTAWQNFVSSWSGGQLHADGGVGKGNMYDPSQAASVTNDFYSFVTDIYEWGWGASFHFAPKLWSHDWKAGEAAQEVRIAHMLRAAPGMKILDVGCGVGGPMRIIAASTGAHVTGITISEYQVERCKKLNHRVCTALHAETPALRLLLVKG